MTAEVDFLPERLRARRVLRRRTVRQVCLLALVAAGLAAWGHQAHTRVRTARAELSLLRERSSGVDRLLLEKTRLEAQQGELLVKERIGRQLGGQLDVLDVLGELERLMPAGVSLTSLNLDGVQVQLPLESPGSLREPRGAMPAERPPRASAHRVRLVVTGLAPSDMDVASFIGQLSASPIFQDVRMGFTRSLALGERRAREFQASCHVAQ